MPCSETGWSLEVSCGGYRKDTLRRWAGGTAPGAVRLGDEELAVWLWGECTPGRGAVGAKTLRQQHTGPAQEPRGLSVWLGWREQGAEGGGGQRAREEFGWGPKCRGSHWRV